MYIKAVEDQLVPQPDLIRFSADLVERARVDRALAYYRAPNKRSRPLHVMHDQHAFIRTDHDLGVLRDLQYVHINDDDKKRDITSLQHNASVITTNKVKS